MVGKTDALRWLTYYYRYLPLFMMTPDGRRRRQLDTDTRSAVSAAAAESKVDANNNYVEVTTGITFRTGGRVILLYHISANRHAHTRRRRRMLNGHWAPQLLGGRVHRIVVVVVVVVVVCGCACVWVCTCGRACRRACVCTCACVGPPFERTCAQANRPLNGLTLVAESSRPSRGQRRLNTVHYFTPRHHIAHTT